MIRRAIAFLLSAIGLIAIGLAVFAVSAGPASASGTPTPTPTPAPVVPSTICANGSVVTSSDVGAPGGTVTGTVGGSTVSVNVPAGVLPDFGAQVAITALSSVTPPNGTSIVLAFGVNFCVDGAKFTGTFSPPVTVTVTNPAIKPGQVLYELTASGALVQVQANVVTGSFTITITGDPSFVLVTSSVIPGATTVVTGKPFLLEGLVAGGLVLFGSVLLLRLRFRHR